MKNSLVLIFLFVFGNSAHARTDSTNYIHTFKKQGPVSIQILWVSQNAGTAFAEESAWLKASIHGSTENYEYRDFKNLCVDYGIKWQLSSQNGIHRLGVSFAQQQFELATELLDELLNKTSYRTKYINEWRKKQLFNYNYYKNDKDSLLKWWASGKEDYYKYLETNGIEAKGASLIKKLGLPMVVSSIGRINQALLFKKLNSFIKTTIVNDKISFFKTEFKERPISSSFRREGLIIKQFNPIITCASSRNLGSTLSRMVNYWEFSFVSGAGSFYLKSGYSSGKAKSFIPSESDIKWALIQYENWYQKNKNEALANAYINIGLWNVDYLNEALNGGFNADLTFKTYALIPN
ncbi:MAG: hypothetical protein ACPGLV_17610 [Bacteroidia bacterium]